MTFSAPEAAEYWHATPDSDRYPPDHDAAQPGDPYAPAEGPGPYAGAGPDEPSTELGYDDWSQWAAEDDTADPGLSGRRLVVLSAAAAAGCTVVDLMLTGGSLTFFFDLCFVVICLVSTMAVTRSDLFTAGVLPPLVYAGVVAVLTVVAPHAFVADASASKVFLTGLAEHAFGLVSGYGIALLTVAARVAATSARR